MGKSEQGVWVLDPTSVSLVVVVFLVVAVDLLKCAD